MPVKILNKLISPLGVVIQKKPKRTLSDFEKKFPDFEKEAIEIINKSKPYTMTSEERLYGLFKAMEYIAINKIEGDIVECGVWKGGSSMCAILSAQNFNDINRVFYLYDTFEGMSAPTEKDIDILNMDAQYQLDHSKKEVDVSVWCYSAIEEVQQNIALTNIVSEKVKFIKGKVEDTIPGTIPEKIALLRLDTDWYESTYHELVHLFPRLVKNGVIIIDDYGYWKGAREAVDQYIKEKNITILLSRMDDTGRMAIKVE